MKSKILIVATILVALVAFSALDSQVSAYESSLLGAFNPVSATHPATPIQHLIFLISENHAFDNFFGTFPNLPANYSLNPATCMPYNPKQNSKTPCEKPFNADDLPNIQKTDQCHTAQCAVPAYDNGKMDGFYQTDGMRTMAYYDGAGIPYFWDLASYFDLDYNFFSSAMSYSEPNHLYSVAAYAPLPEVVDNVTPYNLSYPEIGTAMTEAGVTWGYFQYNWNDSNDCTGDYGSGTRFSTGGGYDGYWAGEAQFRAVQNTVIECDSLGNIKDFENALSSNTLPQVSFVIPEPSNSGHPGQGTLESNQLFVTSVINDIESSPVWSTSATFVTWDDYGGYYDNIVPVQLDEFGNGFRVPLIAVSPYTMPGGLIGGCVGASTGCSPQYSYYNNYTNSRGVTTQYDFSAFLSTIEYNFGVKPIATRDAEEPNLFYMLNFSQSPLVPLYFNSNYSTAAYPLTSCYSSGGCRLGSAFAPLAYGPLGAGSEYITSGPMAVYNASTPSWAESPAQAAAYAGNGDPDD